MHVMLRLCDASYVASNIRLQWQFEGSEKVYPSKKE